MKRGSLVLACLALSAGGTPALAANGVFTTWASAAAKGPHLAVATETTTVKAVVDDAYLGLAYEWNCGNGTFVTGTIDDPFAVEAACTYDTAGTYTATLTVTDASGPVGQDTYDVTALASAPADNSREAKDIAVEKGLWWAHKYLYRDPASPVASFRWDWAQEAATILVAQGFVDNGFTVSDAATALPGTDLYYEDPYREDVRRMVNYVTARLAGMSIATATRPGVAETGSTMLDNQGVYFVGNEKEYEFGAALQLLSTCGYHTSTPQVGGVSGWTFNQLAQQMVDWLAWAMLNTGGSQYINNYGVVPPAKVAGTQTVRGSWPYWAEGWEDGKRGDASLAWWTVRGLEAARANMGAAIQAGIKTNLATFFNNTTLVRRAATTPSNLRGELYFGPAQCYHLVERSGQALLLYQWLNTAGGTNWRGTPLTQAKTHLSSNWGRHNYEHSQSHPNAACTPTAACPANGQAGGCWSHYSLATSQQSLVFYEGDPQVEPGQEGAVVNKTLDVFNQDTINIFAFLTITTGLKAINQTVPFPGTVGTVAYGDHKDIYRGLLTKNQLSDGAWSENGWSNGDPWATGWALSTLALLNQ